MGAQDRLDSASVTSVVSKWRSFSFIFNARNRKVRWVEADSRIVFGKKIPRWKRKCETVRCRDATASSFVVEVFATFSRSRRKASQQYAELTVWTARTNSLWTILLMSNKMMRMLLTSLLTCLAFFGLPLTEHAIQTLVYGSCFLPRTLV
jgi:hypothetical protein